jgi:hypothetical protein
LVPASIEVILVALSRDAAIVNGMYGTVVITSQTAGTLSVVQPRGRRTCDIVYRTHLAALAAAGAYVFIDGELLVSNHLLVEVSANDV